VKLLVVGLDPGTTVGYCVLGIDGELIRLSSSKQLSFESVVAEIFRLGSPVVVGSDKAHAPALVERFSRVTGARLVLPKSDLKVSEKKGFASGFRVRNEHERDAAAAAIFAYKKSKQLITKLKKATSHLDAGLRDRVFLRVLRSNGISIKGELRSELSSEPQPVRKQKRRPSPKIPSRLELAKRRISVLEKRNTELSCELDELKHRLSKSYKLSGRAADSLLEKHLSEKKALILKLKSRVKQLERALSDANDRLRHSKRFWTYYNSDKVLLKRLRDLRWETYKRAMVELSLRDGDVLLVDNPCLWSKKTVAMMKDVIGCIVYIRQPSKAIITNTDIVFVNIAELREGMVQWDEFAIVDRKRLESVMVKKGLLRRIIEGYRRNS